MNISKVIKIAGPVLSFIGVALSLANNKLDELKMKEEVKNEVKRALSEENDEEETE